MAKTIWTTAKDKDRLLACLEALDFNSGHREQAHIRELATELERAKVFKNPKQTPDNLITMRSKVTLKNTRTGNEMECSLVYPEEGNAEQYRISVLAPLGTAMLGHRVGDRFDVQLPKGLSTFEVLALNYQPESAGDDHL